jgi:hypothetical protein
MYTLVKFKQSNKASFILQPKKVPTKVYILSLRPHFIQNKYVPYTKKKLAPCPEEQSPQPRRNATHSLNTSGVQCVHNLQIGMFNWHFTYLEEE